jgi:hypothetical protein
MSWEDFKKYVTVHGGTRLKVPTLSQMSRQREDYDLHRAVVKSDQDPDAVVEVARRFKKSPRSAQEIFNEMVTNLDPKRYGEHEVYGDDNA